MSEKIKKAVTDAEVLFFQETDAATVQEILKECTPDMASYTQKRDAALVKIKFLAQAAANQQRDQKLLQLASRFKDAIAKNTDKPIHFLQSLISQKVATAFNSNLDKLSQEEIIELIKDQNLVNLLEQFDQDGAHLQGEA
jgi:hypothetical protein